MALLGAPVDFQTLGEMMPFLPGPNGCPMVCYVTFLMAAKVLVVTVALFFLLLLFLLLLIAAAAINSNSGGIELVR